MMRLAEFAYLAVHFQDGTHDRLDEAIAELLGEQHMPVLADAAFDKIDEIGFDHTAAAPPWWCHASTVSTS